MLDLNNQEINKKLDILDKKREIVLEEFESMKLKLLKDMEERNRLIKEQLKLFKVYSEIKQDQYDEEVAFRRKIEANIYDRITKNSNNIENIFNKENVFLLLNCRVKEMLNI